MRDGRTANIIARAPDAEDGEERGSGKRLTHDGGKKYSTTCQVAKPTNRAVMAGLVAFADDLDAPAGHSHHRPKERHHHDR
jgi:hypothetical protein